MGEAQPTRGALTWTQVHVILRERLGGLGGRRGFLGPFRAIFPGVGWRGLRQPTELPTRTSFGEHDTGCLAPRHALLWGTTH
jgi:hypothetical protein